MNDNAGFSKEKAFTGVDTSTKNLDMTKVLNSVFIWAGIICVLIIVVSGIMYVTSAGDSGKVTRAKNAITYALVGLGIIIFAFSIVNFVIGAV